MLPSIPRPDDYEVSPVHGFLPSQLPLEVLPNAYYAQWEAVATNINALILSRRLRGVLDRMPVLSTRHLSTLAEQRRAYSLLAFFAHAYIWGSDRPAEVVPPPISIPFLAICKELELPPVATYAGLVLWNFRPIFNDEPIDNLENLATIMTFTGSLDESWFFLISVAIEARAGPIIPAMLDAIRAARERDTARVTALLQSFAERLDELGALLQRMYDNCDPHIFYHRIRPFFAGSKNMADAGLPNGVIFDTGDGTSQPVQYSGASNAQSSLVQFFDIVLGVEHRPTGTYKHKLHTDSSTSDSDMLAAPAPPEPASSNNFLKDMRQYMPGPHRRFLESVADVANIRDFVEQHRDNTALSVAYDACLAMLRAFRDKHIQMVSRYIVVKSREVRSQAAPAAAQAAPARINLATPKTGDAVVTSIRDSASAGGHGHAPAPRRRPLRGTGGTALISFLKQARDETDEPSIGTWARRILSDAPAAAGFGFSPPATSATLAQPFAVAGSGTAPLVPAKATGFASLSAVDEKSNGRVDIVGLAGIWSVDDSEGGICHW